MRERERERERDRERREFSDQPNIAGEYLWDFRKWNHKINGKTLRDWYFDDYVFNADGGGSPLVTGYYFDDGWLIHGPTECLGNLSVADMGLTERDLLDIMAAYGEARLELFAETIKRGQFAWQMFLDVPMPSSKPKICADEFRIQCTQHGYSNDTIYVNLPKDNSDPKAVETAVATFLLVRKEYAFIGHGW